MPLQRSLVRRARVTMVTEQSLGAIVKSWGGEPLVFHEALPPVHPTKISEQIGDRPMVVFTTIYDSDEPLDAITTAACELKECDVAITGDDARLAKGLRVKLLQASHVHLTGWLDQAQYLALIARADIVIALTSDPYSVMRSAFEASYLRRPTVLSNTATLRSYFSPSVFVENSSFEIVRGVRSIVADYSLWIGRMDARQGVLMRRCEGQLAALESAMGSAANDSPTRTGSERS